MLDVVLDRGRVIAVREDGTWIEVGHRPWFLATRVPSGCVGFEELRNVKMYVFDERRLVFEPVYIVFKIYARHPKEVPVLAREVEAMGGRVSMANIRYRARVSMDLADELFGVKIPLPLHYRTDELYELMRTIFERSKDVKVLAFDIEVAPSIRGSFPRPGDRVFLVSYVETRLGDESEEPVVLEGDQVHDFVKVLERTDANYIVGFVSKDFDIPYLTSYLTDLSETLSTMGYIGSRVIPHIDLAEVLYAHGSSFGLPTTVRLALDAVAEILGLASREELEIEGSIDRTRIFEEYKEHRERVLKYAETDARLTARIARVVLPPLLMLYALTGIAPSVIPELPSQGALAEYALCDYLLRKHGIALELRSRRFGIKELVDGLGIYRKGSKVYVSFSGDSLFENVAVFDFNMLYPTIYYVDRVDAINMRPCRDGFRIYLVRSSNEDEEEESEASSRGAISLRVCTEPGPIHEWMSWFYAARAVTKRMKKELGIEVADQAVKIVANAIYGMFSKGRGNGLNELVSSYIFFRANQIFNITRGFVETVIGRKVIYGDTDSMFVLLSEGDDPATIEEAINRFLSRTVGSELSVKFEKLFVKLAFVGKKNYIGLTSDGKVVVKGIVRYEASRVIKENLDEIFKRVLSGEPPARILEELFSSARISELFARAVKRLTELYDEEEGRFKRPSHASSKAVIVRYLLDSNAINNGVGVFEFHRDCLPTYPVSALYLKKGSDVCVLINETSDGAECFCARIVDLDVGDEYLRGRIVGTVRRMTRREILALARETSRTIIEVLERIHRLTGAMSLDRFAR